MLDVALFAFVVSTAVGRAASLVAPLWGERHQCIATHIARCPAGTGCDNDSTSSSTRTTRHARCAGNVSHMPGNVRRRNAVHVCVRMCVQQHTHTHTHTHIHTQTHTNTHKHTLTLTYTLTHTLSPLLLPHVAHAATHPVMIGSAAIASSHSPAATQPHSTHLRQQCRLHCSTTLTLCLHTWS